MQFTFSPADISTPFATRAYSGISFDPEKRAAQEQADYTKHMQTLLDELTPYATTPEQQAELSAQLERYKQGYLKHLQAYLAAKSRCISPMITGPARFPTRQQEKRHETQHRRLNELVEWSARAQKALRRRFNPPAPRGISSARTDAVQQLQAKLKAAEQLQARMVSANRIVRLKCTPTEKIAGLVKLNISEAAARKLLEPDFAGRKGFPDYLLKNNSAEIRRINARIAEVQREQARPAAEERTIPGGKIIENTEACRLQIIFDQKPDEATRARLKANGFHWAPSEGAWQRLLNANARAAVRRLYPIA